MLTIKHQNVQRHTLYGELGNQWRHRPRIPFYGLNSRWEFFSCKRPQLVTKYGTKLPPLYIFSILYLAANFAGSSFSFSDRAEGENWLQRQDISVLLRESQTVREIGTAGWCQQRVPIALESPHDIEGSSPSAAEPFCLTFFHNPTTEVIRWSLSPRSALETPRTPRREAYRSNHAASSDANLHADEIDRAEEAGNGTGWELVEDGDMVFYYNRSMGVSSWEPPAAWHAGGEQHESSGG